jgi:hypothetical protein
MKTLRIIGVVAVSGAILALAPMGSAMADDTTATFTLGAAGTLTLTAQASAPAPLVAGDAGIATSASGSLGAVTVTDQRGGTTGWVVSAVSTAFSEGTGPDSSGVTYTPGAVTEGGDSNTAVASGSVMTALQVVTATAVVGNNSATFNPTLTVALPSNALQGTYTGTVTTSVV